MSATTDVNKNQSRISTRNSLLKQGCYIYSAMSKHRSKISNSVKKRLIKEAGDKCANPGCANRRTHIHHIREWAVYQTHDERHMIAVCPSCHDAIHHGAITIDDSVLYQWKNITRSSAVIHSHVYIEPHNPTKLILGTIAVTTNNQAIVFHLSPLHRLKFSVREMEILLIDLSVATLNGQEVLRVTDNYIKHNSRSDVQFLQIPGSISVVIPCTNELFLIGQFAK